MDCNYTITDDTIHTFKNVNAGKLGFACFRLDLTKGQVVPDIDLASTEEKRAVVTTADDNEFTSFESNTFAEFYKKIIVTKEPRFCALTFKAIEPKENRKVSKSCLILWCPGTASVRQKMISAGTFQKLCAKLCPLKKLEAHDAAAISYEHLRDEIL